ncbi:MAG: DUF2911 domain-containing protein [Gemmatimonadaceae bacterium]
MKHALILLAIAAPAIASAQSGLRSAPSGRGITQIAVAPARVEGQPAPTPLLIKIDYGQPHARGRAIAGALEADIGKVWRLGANEATSLQTDVDLLIGGATIPKGTYTLYAETTPNAWKLIVNRRTGADGLEYLASADVAKVPLQARTLSSPIESLTIWLIPGAGGAPNGELRFAWGTLEHSVAWSIKQ